jgi:SAM-dependent methyltransferase
MMDRRPESAERAPRSDDFEAAARLAPGDHHYRAFVGPPDRFDFMSATQFTLLFHLGLREHHRVLDFGCGSLRLGRLLIPFLLPGRYYGIEPNDWLIRDALDCELGHGVVSIKQPHFAHNDDFRCDVFEVPEGFDFIMAQSILSHCGPDLAEKLVKEAAKVLAASGKFLFTCVNDPDGEAMPNRSGWVYPECVAFGASRIERICTDAGLVCRHLPWYHPNQVWSLAARTEANLPSDRDLPSLQGTVLFDPQFEASRSRR